MAVGGSVRILKYRKTEKRNRETEKRNRAGREEVSKPSDLISTKHVTK